MTCSLRQRMSLRHPLLIMHDVRKLGAPSTLWREGRCICGRNSQIHIIWICRYITRNLQEHTRITYDTCNFGAIRALWRCGGCLVGRTWHIRVIGICRFITRNLRVHILITYDPWKIRSTSRPLAVRRAHHRKPTRRSSALRRAALPPSTCLRCMCVRVCVCVYVCVCVCVCVRVLSSVLRRAGRICCKILVRGLNFFFFIMCVCLCASETDTLIINGLAVNLPLRCL